MGLSRRLERLREHSAAVFLRRELAGIIGEARTRALWPDARGPMPELSAILGALPVDFRREVLSALSDLAEGDGDKASEPGGWVGHRPLSEVLGADMDARRRRC